MGSEKTMRLSQLARTLNVGTSTIVDYLGSKGFEIENKPNSKIIGEQVVLLKREFSDSAQDKEEASELVIGTKNTPNVVIDRSNKSDESSVEELKITNHGSSAKVDPKEEYVASKVKLGGLKQVGKIDLDGGKAKKAEPKKVEEKPKAEEPIKTEDKPQKTEVKVEVKKTVETPKVEAPKKETPKVEVPKVEAPKKEIPKKEAPKAEIKKVAEEPKKDIPVSKPETKQDAPKKVEAAPKTETPQKTEAVEVPPVDKTIRAKSDNLKGLTVLGKIELPKEQKKGKPGNNRKKGEKRKRVRIEKPVDVKKAGTNTAPRTGKPFKKGEKSTFVKGKKVVVKEEISQKDIQDKIKATMARLSGGGGNRRNANKGKYKQQKRSQHAEQRLEALAEEEMDARILKCTEFVSANDLAVLMDTTVNDVISKCMMLGMIVSINQRLDAEAITIIADEFGYEVQFTTSDEETDHIIEINDAEEDMTHRAPIVTIMGHVDHGKTSLLDYIRKAKVADGEAGGITQHIGSYSVKTDSGKEIAFLDTPGHEAFTAMRARGAKLTDIVILVVAADDRVMPQTKEAINHAQVAGVPIVIALNKIDKPTSNPDKIREELSAENILVEEWGGKYQCQEVSAKKGTGIDDLLEKVLLEAELLDLKANADRDAIGTVVEASLDKGRGYVTNILVQTGTLKIGDIVVAGSNHGKVKAMLDHTGKKLKSAGPSTPIQLLGLDGAPQAGDRFTVAENEKEAKDTCNRRAQILREQSVRTKKHLTLDEIGRRLAIGTFKELNVIIKGDVDGSVEALTDSLLKLSTDEVQVNVIHKAVGQITESDVLLATASEAIIIGFQVRPSIGAKRLADTEEIEIRHYSIIYKAIDEMKDALEGLLEPDSEEVITGNIEVRDVFKISKIGTVAGCYVLDGFVKRNNPIRLIRDGVVKYEGEIGALKRFKDDVSEVKNNYECGLSIKNYNDIRVGDVVESYETREIKRKLK